MKKTIITGSITSIFIIVFNIILIFNAKAASDTYEKNNILDVYELWSEFQNNTNADNYVGKTITVKGYVISTGISIYATPNVRLSNEKNGQIYVICVLPRTDFHKLSSFEQEQHVIMSGRVYRLSQNGVVLKECKLQTD